MYDSFFYAKFEQNPMGDDKVIKATLTTFGNPDKVGDIIEAGALDKFIREVDDFPIMFQHSLSDVIGKWKNLRVEGNKFKADG